MQAFGSHRSHSETARRLGDELDRATAEFMRVESIAAEIIREVPSGLPAPDGQFRISQADKKLKFAFEQYRRAVKRYRDFIDNGIEPELAAEKAGNSQ